MSNVTLTIQPTPADATVTLTATGYTQVNNTITVEEGTVVTYSVVHTNYASSTGTYTVNATATVAIDLTKPTSIDINVVAENLSELLANSVNMTAKFYDLFINPVEMNVELQMYNDENELITVTVPNRAKDRKIAITGNNSPEGVVTANVGATYVDIIQRKVYYKTQGTGNTGWTLVLTSETIPTKISDLTDDTATYPIDKANTLTGLTATVSELNYCDGVTSNIQTQLDSKATDSNVVHLTGAETVSGTKTFSSDIVGNLNGNASSAGTLTGLTATVSELNYCDGVTLNIQTQIDGKQATLVSGTNIKTVNSTSLLGSGDVDTHIIGEPVITFNSTLGSNEIWLEGAEVSKTTYATLYSIYGDTFGTPVSSDNFVLPDFRNRAVWGSGDGAYGYLSAGLPNISGDLSSLLSTIGTSAGALWQSGTQNKANLSSGSVIGGVWIDFEASGSNSIYGSSTTVQPPAIKVRVKTRYQ